MGKTLTFPDRGGVLELKRRLRRAAKATTLARQLAVDPHLQRSDH
jgi:hypothetical protein